MLWTLDIQRTRVRYYRWRFYERAFDIFQANTKSVFYYYHNEQYNDQINFSLSELIFSQILSVQLQG